MICGGAGSAFATSFALKQETGFRFSSDLICLKDNSHPFKIGSLLIQEIGNDEVIR